jgi:hypothetical protein
MWGIGEQPGELRGWRRSVGGGDGCGALVAGAGVTTNNPMSTGTLPDVAAVATATSTLTGPDAHGCPGVDSAAVVDATNHIFSGEKGRAAGYEPERISVCNGRSVHGAVLNGQTPVDNSWFPVYQALMNAINAQGWEHRSVSKVRD